MKRHLFLISLLLGAFTEHASGQVMPFTHYTTESERNALPSAEVHKVYQDGLGFVWMAIFSSGLVRYDGVNMQQYGTGDGLRDLGVWDVLEDPTGRLWIGSNAGLVVSDRPLAEYGAGQRVRFVSQREGVPLLDLAINYNRMAIDHEGWLWVGTDGMGIVRYRVSGAHPFAVDTLRTAPAGAGADNVPVRALIARTNGSVWAALGDGTMLVFARGARVPAVIPPELAGADASTSALHEDRDGVLWGGRRNGEVWRLDEAAGARHFTVVNGTLQSNISGIVGTSDSTLWVTSEGSGVLRLSPSGEQIQHIGRTQGLLSDIVYAATQDREGNVWISQSGGASRLRFNFAAFENVTAVAEIGQTPLLPSPSVNAVLPGRDAQDPCRLLAGTSEGGIACIERSGTSTTLRQQDGLWSNWVNGFAYDAAGRLWIGTSHGLNGLSFDSEPFPPNASRVAAVTFGGRPGRLASYVSGSILAVVPIELPPIAGRAAAVRALLFPGYHVLYGLVGDRWFTLDANDGLPLAVLHAAALDGDGHLWVGTRDQGLYRSTSPVSLEALLAEASAEDPSRPRFERVWSVETGAPTNQIETLRWHADLMWVGTPMGLVALAPGDRRVVAHLTTASGMNASNATSVAVSPRTGHLWVGTNGGLAEVDPSAHTVVRTLTKQDGLVDNEVWWNGSVFAGPDGTIYFGTAKGISIYYPARDRRNAVPPLLRLTSVARQTNGSGRVDMEFEYAGLSFASERQVRYRTRLLGYETEWSEPKADVKLRYTNLSAFFVPRTYTLQVMAANDDGVWAGQPLEYAFEVAPRWWASWWAFILYALLLGVGLFGLYRFQHRRLIRRERQHAHEREQALRLEASEAWASYLNAENERKTAELESARQLQLSLLPEHLPQHPAVEIAARMCTATEVGGDYYDFHVAADGTLTVAIGDATGHGAAAGTVVTATKGLFLLLAGETSLEDIMQRATRALKQMKLRRMFMAMALARVRGRTIEFAGGGLPAAFVYRAATGAVETVVLKGMPLGGPVDYPYHTETIDVEAGDVVLMMTDGFSEIFNDQREMLGDERARALFAEAARESPEALINHLMNGAARWLGYETNGEDVPDSALDNQDDVTFVVLKMR